MSEKYEVPNEGDLISGATTNANRDEVIDILANEDIEAHKAYLEHLKKLFAEDADPKIGNQIAVLEDKIAIMEEKIKNYQEGSVQERQQEKYPFESEHKHIN